VSVNPRIRLYFRGLMVRSGVSVVFIILFMCGILLVRCVVSIRGVCIRGEKGMRLITLEERRRHRKIEDYIETVNKILILLLIFIVSVILFGWIIW
jgi:hypothetical protein